VAVPLQRRRTLVQTAAGLALAGVAVWAGLRFDAQLAPVVDRIERANPWLLIPALALEALSFGGYVALFRATLEGRAPWLGWRAITQLTFAGVVATRLFAAGGAGGIALTAWALDAAGLEPRESARRIAAFLVVLYSLFVGLLALSAIGLLGGLLGARAPTALALAGLVTALAVAGVALATLLVPDDLERRVGHVAARPRAVGALGRRLTTVPAVAGEASRLALRLVCARPSILLFALAWWGFDIAVLVVAFDAWGRAPALTVVVFCYFLGHVGGLLPMPGGVGGVEGGMIACFVVCGVPLSLAVVATVAYQLVSTWLPALAGLGFYADLRRTVARWKDVRRRRESQADRPTPRTAVAPCARRSPSPEPTTLDPSRVR
jgi:uncharacterized membrane protein YbhN (UPF0104 family)